MTAQLKPALGQSAPTLTGVLLSVYRSGAVYLPQPTTSQAGVWALGTNLDCPGKGIHHLFILMKDN